MNTRISLRLSVVCLGFGGCVGFVYLLVCRIIAGINYRDYHKTGSGTEIQEWLYALSDFIVGFPFGSSLINSFIWLLVGVGVCAVLLRRKRARSTLRGDDLNQLK